MDKSLKKLAKSFHKGQKGLTLIELLIVVAILGIIAAVVIPNLSGFMITGRISAANTELENVKTASLAYYAEEEEWPGTSDGDLEDNFMAGELDATYTFCTTYGWVINGVDGPDGVMWDAPDSGSTCDGTATCGCDGHGRWVRDDT